MFEKRVSGMFLGEIFRQVLLSLIESSNLFNGKSSVPLTTQYGIDTATMSDIARDKTAHLEKIGEKITTAFGISESILDDRKAVKLVSEAIVRRSARLAAVAISAISDHTGRFSEATEAKPVDVGVDGSLVEHYPMYCEMCLAACKDILGGNADKRIRLGLAKDGSGVGAALYFTLIIEFIDKLVVHYKQRSKKQPVLHGSGGPFSFFLGCSICFYASS